MREHKRDQGWDHLGECFKCFVYNYINIFEEVCIFRLVVMYMLNVRSNHFKTEI